MRIFRDGYSKGTNNSNINDAMAKAEWLFYNYPATEQDWDELPLSLTKLYVAHYLYTRDCTSRLIKQGILSALQELKRN